MRFFHFGGTIFISFYFSLILVLLHYELINTTKQYNMLSILSIDLVFSCFAYSSLSYLQLLAHLSRRLTGELITYPWIRRPSASVVRRPSSTFSNIFSSETAWPIKAKFYVEPPWEGGTKVYINGLGHMTKMAATPIYGKNPSKIFFSRTGRPIFTKLGM